MQDIKYLVLDVDGTLTDGCVYMSDNGELCKAFNIKDGYAMAHMIPAAEMEILIITGRTSKIVENRCKELGITEVHQGVADKLTTLETILEKNGSSLKDCAYMGDDLNDLGVMNAIQGAGGFVGCPADAVDEVIKQADFVSKKDGGRGCVREFIEWLIK